MATGEKATRVGGNRVGRRRPGSLPNTTSGAPPWGRGRLFCRNPHACRAGSQLTVQAMPLPTSFPLQADAFCGDSVR